MVVASVRTPNGTQLLSGAYGPKTSEADINAVDSVLHIDVAYIDTKFSTCTFEVSDHYELDPLFVTLSVVDESGEPCANLTGTTVETQKPILSPCQLRQCST